MHQRFERSFFVWGSGAGRQRGSGCLLLFRNVLIGILAVMQA